MRRICYIPKVKRESITEIFSLLENKGFSEKEVRELLYDYDDDGESKIISKVTYSNWIKGKTLPSLTKLFRAAKLLQTELEDIFSYEYKFIEVPISKGEKNKKGTEICIGFNSFFTEEENISFDEISNKYEVHICYYSGCIIFANTEKYKNNYKSLFLYPYVNNETIKKNLSKNMKKRGFSAKVWETLFDEKTAGAISNWQRGVRIPKNIEKIINFARFFNIPLKEFCGVEYTVNSGIQLDIYQYIKHESQINYIKPSIEKKVNAIVSTENKDDSIIAYRNWKNAYDFWDTKKIVDGKEQYEFSTEELISIWKNELVYLNEENELCFSNSRENVSLLFYLKDRLIKENKYNETLKDYIENEIEFVDPYIFYDYYNNFFFDYLNGNYE